MLHQAEAFHSFELPSFRLINDIAQTDQIRQSGRMN